MFSIAGSSVTMPSLSTSLKHSQVSSGRISGVKLVSAPSSRASFPLRRSYRQRSLQVCCAAKPETVEKVAGIVRKQLALSEDSKVNGESKFSELGADSLDTVEIVMGLEEEFDISVEEESAQTITTVQEAADLIETLISKPK
ncbi:acyl carrier protein 1, chloroplastic-like [Cucurbita pepo subsp. pepo]|uniref:acyl carrier protein 1, chloroplastic-like n=1 Tax=Cucurbita pepo subsp. pepo TaxID=3664 RepID=UPI000C9D94BA|nr:acyl carrier protein 1, chloroplastic-like [Cucurbita pepo subsp. pepo]